MRLLPSGLWCSADSPCNKYGLPSIMLALIIAHRAADISAMKLIWLSKLGSEVEDLEVRHYTRAERGK